MFSQFFDLTNDLNVILCDGFLMSELRSEGIKIRHNTIPPLNVAKNKTAYI